MSPGIATFTVVEPTDPQNKAISIAYLPPGFSNDGSPAISQYNNIVFLEGHTPLWPEKWADVPERTRRSASLQQEGDCFGLGPRHNDYGWVLRAVCRQHQWAYCTFINDVEFAKSPTTLFLTCHSECSEESPAKGETLHCAQGDMIGVAGLSTHTVRSRRQGRLSHILDFCHK